MQTGQLHLAAESFPLQYEGRGTILDVPQDTSLKFKVSTNKHTVHTQGGPIPHFQDTARTDGRDGGALHG
jgi:hypothetical protein